MTHALLRLILESAAASLRAATVSRNLLATHARDARTVAVVAARLLHHAQVRIIASCRAQASRTAVHFQAESARATLVVFRAPLTVRHTS